MISPGGGMASQDGSIAPVSFDPDALRARYREERDKRLRRDGNEQYVEMAGRYAHYLDDPYCRPVERPACREQVDVVLIGGGFAGLIAGALPAWRAGKLSPVDALRCD